MTELFVLVAVLIGAVSQAVTGIGFALVCAPLLTIALGGADGVRFANVLAIFVNILVVRRELKDLDWRQVLMMFIPAAIAAPIAAWAIRDANADVLSIASGVLILIAVAALATGARIKQLVGRAGAAIAGSISGVMNVVGGVGGPAIASYALNADMKPERMRPTLGMYFLLLNVVSVAARGVPALDGEFVAASLITLFVGFSIGALVARHVDKKTVQTTMLVLAAGGGIGAIMQGLA